MPQRIKASIDSALEQEQAKARALHQSPARSAAGAKKVTSRAISPTRRLNRQSSKSRQDNASKAPDPADFEAEFVIDDEELSRSGTPKPAADGNRRDGVEDAAASRPAVVENEQENSTKEAEPALQGDELPTDVRVKLRKLDKLEGKYHGIAIDRSSPVHLTYQL